MKQLTRRQALSTGALAGAAILLPRYARAAEFNWKFTSSQPAAHASTVRYLEAAERVKQKSGGRFEITVFHSGQLGTDIDTFTQVRIGGVHMMVLSNLITATAAPLTSLCSMPFALPSYTEIWQAMDGKLGQLLRADLEKAGYLTTDRILDDGFHQITSSTKPINTVADLQGFKLRAPPSPLLVSTWRALGAAPTTMNFSELYTALQTGVVEGQESAIAYMKANRIFEVQKYVSLTSHLWDGWYTLINPRAFKRLPKDMADLVMESFNQAGIDERGDLADLNESAKGFLAEKGMQITTPPDMAPFRSKLKEAGFYKEWKEKMGPEAWALLENISGPLA
jgi:tripartite ATP-independent transporter DctP family solute receptor